MAFEHFDYFILVDRPVQHHMILLRRNDNRVVVVGVRQLLDLIIFHEQFSIALCVGGEVHVEGLAIGDVEDFAVVGEVETGDVGGVLFYYFGGF